MSWIREGQYTAVYSGYFFNFYPHYPSGLRNYSFKLFQTIINLYSCFVTFISLTISFF